MMLVPTYLWPSRIHGIACHAAALIPKGTIVWRYTEGVDKRIANLCKASKAIEDFVSKHGYRESGKEFIEVCGDNALFFNHSNTPNCQPNNNGESVAIRDILHGEELTEDYRTFNTLPMPFLLRGKYQ